MVTKSFHLLAIVSALGGIGPAPNARATDLSDHQRGPGFFTLVAGSCVLGAQFVLIAGDYEVAVFDQMYFALRAVHDWKPDLILADWYRSDGAQFIHELHRVPRFLPPPVVLIEGIIDPNAVSTARDLAQRRGALDFLPRPLPEEDGLDVPADRLDQLGRAAQLVAQIPHVHVDDVGERVGRGRPHRNTVDENAGDPVARARRD